jgi:hypothetical protein
MTGPCPLVALEAHGTIDVIFMLFAALAWISCVQILPLIYSYIRIFRLLRACDDSVFYSQTWTRHRDTTSPLCFTIHLPYVVICLTLVIISCVVTRSASVFL